MYRAKRTSGAAPKNRTQMQNGTMNDDNEFRICEAHHTDIEALVALRCAEQREIYPAASEPVAFRSEFSDYLRRAVADPDTIVIVCRRKTDDAVVATLSASIEHQPPQFIDNGVYAYLCNAYTHPEYRRRKLLERMYDRIVPILRERQVAALYADSIMPAIHAFLQRRGWTRRHDYLSRYF